MFAAAVAFWRLYLYTIQVERVIRLRQPAGILAVLALIPALAVIPPIAVVAVVNALLLLLAFAPERMPRLLWRRPGSA